MNAEIADHDQVLIALDLGTSSCKGAIYAPDGTLLTAARHAYPVQRLPNQYVEQDPAAWWCGIQAICREMVAEFPDVSVAAVGLSGQVPTMVLVDENGQALCPAITWQDRRAEHEASWLRDHIGAEQLAEWLGVDLPIDAGWPPARLLWWRRHAPELLGRAKHVLMAKDYLLAQLTGEFFSDAWSAKGLVHLLTGAVPSDYYAAIDVPSTIAPKVLPPATVGGVVHQRAADLTGLPLGTPVIVGWSDALCGMAGTGAIEKADLAFDLTGTSDIIGLSGAKPRRGLMHIPQVITSAASILYGPTQSGGDSLAWFAEWVGQSVDDVVTAATTAAVGADGVIFLPYLQGERAPLWDSAARGALVGLRREHGAAVGGRAVMEGVAMSVRHVLEACGVYADSNRILRLAGGSSRVEIWNQIRADVIGLTVEVVAGSDATLLGAAMVGAVGAGLYPDLPAASLMIRVGRRYFPDPASTAIYEGSYTRYRALYPALRSVFDGTTDN